MDLKKTTYKGFPAWKLGDNGRPFNYRDGDKVGEQRAKDRAAAWKPKPADSAPPEPTPEKRVKKTRRQITEEARAEFDEKHDISEKTEEG